MACMLMLVACSGQMSNQARHEPLEPSAFFTDGQSSRHLVDGTVPRGYLEEDAFLYTGTTDGTGGGEEQGGVPADTGQSGSAQTGDDEQGGDQDQGNADGDDATGTEGAPDAQEGAPQDGGGTEGDADQGEAEQQGGEGGQAAEEDVFPFAVTRDVLERGQERYNIYCAPCHDRVGNGEGMIVRRGFARPPSLHIERLRQAPASHFFNVITNGWGAMPSYEGQVPVYDRWAIAGYIRALQLSQNATVDDVPEAERGQLQGGDQTP
ncbi:MAG TPA: c-type cytochrome [Ardenticatenaceae bacterium]|nr:c-type cytochrome [Ardenticatenaceae bacterium]